MKKTNLLMAFVMFLSFSVLAQSQTIEKSELKEEKTPQDDQKSIAVFYVKDARSNGVDVTQQYIEGGTLLHLYKNIEYDKLLFSNFLENNDSQSYGEIYSIVRKIIPETEELYRVEMFSFYWSYNNTYDDESGTAEIRINLVYKPQGVAFKVTIVSEDLDELVFKGEMVGDMSLLDNYIDKKQE